MRLMIGAFMACFALLPFPTLDSQAQTSAGRREELRQFVIKQSTNPKAGDVGYTFDTAGGPTHGSLFEWMKAHTAGDAGGQQYWIRKNNLVKLSDGVKVRVLDNDESALRCRVLVLSGPYAGKNCFVPFGAVSLADPLKAPRTADEKQWTQAYGIEQVTTEANGTDAPEPRIIANPAYRDWIRQRTKDLSMLQLALLMDEAGDKQEVYFLRGLFSQRSRNATNEALLEVFDGLTRSNVMYVPIIQMLTARGIDPIKRLSSDTLRGYAYDPVSSAVRSLARAELGRRNQLHVVNQFSSAHQPPSEALEGVPIATLGRDVSNDEREIAPPNTSGILGFRWDLGRDQRPVVVAVVPGTPAFQSGLQVGDRILWVNRYRTMGMAREQFGFAVSGNAGTAVTLKVERGAAVIDLPMTRVSLKDLPENVRAQFER